ncbi:MAG: hypothetical protein U0174_28070 [Polyangiaceae bacterium]
MALLFAAFVLLVATSAFGKRVTVRGKTRIDVRAHRALGGRTVLQGELKDDGDRALAGERVSLDVKVRGPDGAVTSPSADLFHACSARAVDAIERSPAVYLHTDEQGRFCVSLAVQTGVLFAKVAFAGEPLEDPSSSDLEFDVERRGVSLSFSPLPRVVRLDGSDFAVSVIAQSEDEGIMHAEPDLSLELQNEKGEVLSEAKTDVHGRAAFRVSTARLGNPGPGEIRALFKGSREMNRATAAHPVDRKVSVQLALVGSQDGSVAEDGITLHLKATATPHPVPAGAVEVRIHDTVVGTGVVSGGDATVVVAFHVDEAREQAVTIHYQPSDPYYLPGEPLRVDLSVRPPSPLRALPMVGLFGLVIAFMVLGRRRPRARSAEGVGDMTATENEPVVRVAATDAERARVATGLLLDVHSGAPIVGARVAIERPDFTEASVLASGESDATGHFRLDSAVPFAPGDRIVAEGRLHRRVERPLPGPGDFRIALVSRRRALLDGLVSWARAAGAFGGSAEPTPRDVRARRRDVATWTRAVERAVYTGKEVDASEEAAARKEEPETARPEKEPPPPGTP